VKTVHPVTEQLEPEELDPAQVVSGDPRTSELTLAESDDGQVSGLWRCTPGVVTDTEVEESFLVITGRAVLTYEDGREFVLEPGVTHRFDGGEKTTWDVRETLLKAYWIREG